MLFGEYLIKIEKISEDELNFALEFQRDDNVPNPDLEIRNMDYIKF